MISTQKCVHPRLLYPSSSIRLLLCCLLFLSSGILSSLAMAGMVTIATESLQWSMREKRKKGKERDRGGKRREGGRETLRLKAALHPSLPHSFCLFLHLCFLFFFPSHRLVSWSFSWSFHLFLLSIPPALSLILHLSLCVLELRANYTFWVWETWFIIHTTTLPLCESVFYMQQDSIVNREGCDSCSR